MIVNELITHRLVEMTFAPMEKIIDWLAHTLKLEIVRREEGLVVVRNPHLKLVTAVMAKTDPINRAVCLAAATAGVWWPKAYPSLLEEVDREWRRRINQARATRPPAGAAVHSHLSFEASYRHIAPVPAGACISESPQKGKRSMSDQQFAEILFSNEVQPDDFDILLEPTADKPGLLKLNRAYLGLTRPDAPNSAPLHSWTGAQIGYVARESLLEPPFSDTYWLQEAEDEPSSTG